MSDRREPVDVRANGPVRATGLLSAVLLVVLLASGWSEHSRTLTEGGQVTACEARGAPVVRVPAPREPDVSPRLRAVVAACEARLPPRSRRIDSWGLPPPRAPTA